MRGRLTGIGRGGVSAAVIVVLACALAQPARAADDGYANVFSSLFSAVGIVKPDSPPDIAYRERPPLVLPPQAGLPKPVESATRGASWPKDPDVVRHRKELEEARAPQLSFSSERTDLVTPGELAQGRGSGDANQPTQCNPEGNNRNCLMLSPDELKAEGDRFAAANPDSGEDVVSGQEPPRVYLTQPPKGYLKATKTVKATTEAPEQRVDDSNPRTFLMPQPKTDE